MAARAAHERIVAAEPRAVARPRLAVGLGTFGREVLSGAAWPHCLVLDRESDPWDEVEPALHAILADPALDEAATVEPVLILLADLGGEAGDRLPSGLGGLLRRARAAQSELSGVLMLRLLGGDGPAVRRRARAQAAALVEEVLAPGQPGHGRVSVILIADRDGAGRVYSPEDCARKTEHLLTLLLDPRPADQAGLRDGLAPLPTGYGELQAPWAWTAAFALVELKVFVYPAAAVAAARRSALVARLDPVLQAPAPSTWEPRAPALRRLGLEPDTRMDRPALPRWQPGCWREPGENASAARHAFAVWRERAEEWSAAQRMRSAIRRQVLHDAGRAALADYRDEAAGGLAALLADESLPGLWPSLDRWLAAALARIEDGPAPPVPTPLPGPASYLAAREPRLAAMARGTNPWLVAVAAVTTMLAVAGLILVASAAGAVHPAAAALWAGLVAGLSLPGPAPLWAVGAAALAASIQAGLTLLAGRRSLERVWDREAHAPAVRWTTAAVAAHRAALASDAAAAQWEIATRARADLYAIAERAAALRRAFDQAPWEVDHGVAAPGDRFIRIIPPSDRPGPGGDPAGLTRSLRRDPDLLAWLISGLPAAAATMRDRLLAAVDDGPGASLAADPESLERLLATLPRDGDETRPVALLHPRHDAPPRWTKRDLLIVPEGAVDLPAVGEQTVQVLTGADDRVLSVSIIGGLTASDLFGPDHGLSREEG